MDTGDKPTDVLLYKSASRVTVLLAGHLFIVLGVFVIWAEGMTFSRPSIAIFGGLLLLGVGRGIAWSRHNSRNNLLVFENGVRVIFDDQAKDIPKGDLWSVYWRHGSGSPTLSPQASDCDVEIRVGDSTLTVNPKFILRRSEYAAARQLSAVISRYGGSLQED